MKFLDFGVQFVISNLLPKVIVVLVDDAWILQLKTVVFLWANGWYPVREKRDYIEVNVTCPMVAKKKGFVWKDACT